MQAPIWRVMTPAKNMDEFQSCSGGGSVFLGLGGIIMSSDLCNHPPQFIFRAIYHQLLMMNQAVLELRVTGVVKLHCQKVRAHCHIIDACVKGCQ
jgi:hypothetical protein